MTTKPARGPQSGASLDRREFIAAAGVAAMAGCLPGQAIASLAHAAGPERVADWTIDDMWTGYPRPAAALRVGRGGASQIGAVDGRARLDPQLLS